MSSLAAILADNANFSVERAQAHLTILRVFCSIYDCLESTPGQTIDQILSVADYRYRLYLDLLVTVHDTPQDTWPLPPWDVALVMHSHMLSPIKFAQDISSSPLYSSLAGKISFPLLALANTIPGSPVQLNSLVHSSRHLWEAHYSHVNIPYELVALTPSGPALNVDQAFQTPPVSPFSLDLVAAVTRQISFARKITALYPYDPVPVHLVADAQQRYAKFTNLVREQAVATAVPAMDIDWLWHTHQLSGPHNYLRWCTRHLARQLNHDDTVEEGPLGDGLQATKVAWEAFYGEDYLNAAPGSGPTFQNAAPVRPPPRKLTLSDKRPPPGLTPAQRELWKFDVARQEDHQRIDCRYHQELQTIHEYDRVLNKNGRRVTPAVTVEILPGAATPHPNAARPSAVGRPASKIRSLLGGFSNFGSPLANLEANRERAAVRAQNIQREARLAREMWGRERWPLLVKARGWGDPKVTAGEWVRPSQGSNSLSFPIYAATWYDDKQLGYHSYIRGGRSATGALTVESGGLVAGGGQCGGHFDGGNCVAAIKVPMRVYQGGDNVHGGGCAG
ncbi:hypothetical protein SEUCBS139899_004302 [Sporothrix eucalyptigena]|uniref:Uncharacterized protein n=1 Tax=Sporothrix eucalyptigena TaxID=1812306 RepID=A0ABP0BSU5_9PEZI